MNTSCNSSYFSCTQVIAGRQAQLSAASEDRIADMEIKTMMEVMGRFRQLSPDGTECGCLKAIVLFKPGERSKHFVHHQVRN